jgi:hypothetical protein
VRVSSRPSAALRHPSRDREGTHFVTITTTSLRWLTKNFHRHLQATTSVLVSAILGPLPPGRTQGCLGSNPPC